MPATTAAAAHIKNSSKLTLELILLVIDSKILDNISHLTVFMSPIAYLLIILSVFEI